MNFLQLNFTPVSPNSSDHIILLFLTLCNFFLEYFLSLIPFSNPLIFTFLPIFTLIMSIFLLPINFIYKEIFAFNSLSYSTFYHELICITSWQKCFQFFFTFSVPFGKVFIIATYHRCRNKSLVAFTMFSWSRNDL